MRVRGWSADGCHMRDVHVCFGWVPLFSGSPLKCHSRGVHALCLVCRATPSWATLALPRCWRTGTALTPSAARQGEGMAVGAVLRLGGDEWEGASAQLTCMAVSWEGCGGCRQLCACGCESTCCHSVWVLPFRHVSEL